MLNAGVRRVGGTESEGRGVCVCVVVVVGMGAKRSWENLGGRI